MRYAGCQSRGSSEPIKSKKIGLPGFVLASNVVDATLHASDRYERASDKQQTNQNLHIPRCLQEARERVDRRVNNMHKRIHMSQKNDRTSGSTSIRHVLGRGRGEWDLFLTRVFVAVDEPI